MVAIQPVKFYCEFCGSQVRPADKICPHCGSFFSEVRCPACQFQGMARMFVDGCPVCGFAAGKDDPAAVSKKGVGAAARPARTGRTNYEVAYVIEDEKPASAGAMPVWALVLIGLAFVAVVLAAVLVAGGRH